MSTGEILSGFYFIITGLSPEREATVILGLVLLVFGPTLWVLGYFLVHSYTSGLREIP